MSLQSIIEIYDILEFVGNFKRPIVEGTELVNSNHFILVCLIENTENTFSIIGLCLQTSNLNGQPHKVYVKKQILENTVKLSGKCSCKAGSGKCKHVVGLMLRLNKMSSTYLAHLSCTDLPQQWGKISNKGKQMYKPLPIYKLCHVNEIKEPYDQCLPDNIPEDLR